MRIGAVSMGDCVVGDLDENGNTIASCGVLNLNPNDPTSGIPYQSAPCMPTGSQGPLQPGQVWCDTGTGIPPANAYAATSRISSGMIFAVVGIGLALVLFKK